PWRANKAEQALAGKKPDTAVFQAAADAELSAARGYKYNTFKIELAKRAIKQALTTVAALA
ncbi:MAG: xanthine dehydrogenase family protein subunit M, partial [Chthoniobacterales bacterium]